jgi:hypothetical protein
MFDSSDSQADGRKEVMNDRRSRSGILVGLAAAAGAFGAAAMMSGASAPTARADDFTDVINVVDGDFAAAPSAYADALTDFSGGDFGPGFAALFEGVDDDFLSAPDNLLVGTVEVATNESVTNSLPWTFDVPATFSDALTDAQSHLTTGTEYLTDAANFLTSGDYGDAALYDLIGTDYISVVSLEDLILGAAVSF